MVRRSGIEAVQTVPPLKITVPKKVRQVSSSPSLLSLSLSSSSAAAGHVGPRVWGGCLYMVLYYNRLASGEDSGSLHAGWIKESLARVLSEQPLLAGRLQKGDTIGGGDEEEEVYVIVANDAGVRLVEARMPLTMSEFLLDLDSSKSNSTMKEAEAELVFWKDVDETDPQFCPLFYVQVTKFECGGYSFGISCSLLLADILFKNFLKKWADIHKNMLSKNGIPERPLFYLPSLKITPSSNVTNIIHSEASKDSGQTIIFNVTYSNKDELITSTLALLCIEEAEAKLGSKMALEFTFSYVKERSNVVFLKKCSKYDQLAIKPDLNLKDRIKSATWDDFGMMELEFRKGNKPVRVSNWIGSVSSGLVMATPYCSEDRQDVLSGMKIIVRVPN
ncbi:Transferase [Parasponia andersonii]|uniref:Transferase n=1 Tax=Parasponia andersonii TaxID=3476 RepID=A0A2P5CU94_PARAD|nr:Transferase [Parasponia andersonii]